MFCNKCGAKVPEAAEFCIKCGSKTVVDNSSQQTSVDIPSEVSISPAPTPPVAATESQNPVNVHTQTSALAPTAPIPAPIPATVHAPTPKLKPNNRKMLAIIAAVALVLIIGAVVFVVLWMRPESGQALVDTPIESDYLEDEDEDDELLDEEITDDEAAHEVEWVTFSGGGMTIDIPSTWTGYWSGEYTNYGNYIEVASEDGTIRMATMPKTFVDDYVNLGEWHTHPVFEFNDGVGAISEDDNGVAFFHPNFMIITLHHEGDRSIFTDNEDLILQIARSLTGESVAQQPTPEPAAENDTSDWIFVDNMVYVPPTWTYEQMPYWGTIFDNTGFAPDTYFWVVRPSPRQAVQYFVDATFEDDFLFDDGHLGVMLETADSVVWLSDIAILVFWHQGNRNDFVANRGILDAVARTLTSENLSSIEPLVNEQGVIGRWRVIEAASSDWFVGGEIIEFFANGFGTEQFQGSTWAFEWYIIENQLLMFYEDMNMLRGYWAGWDWEDSSRLSLSYDAGMPMVFERY